MIQKEEPVQKAVIIQERLNLENIIEVFEKSKSGGSLANNVLEFKQKAFDRFTEIGLPTSKEEIWKYVNLKPLYSANLTKNTSNQRSINEELKTHIKVNFLKECSGACLVFLDGNYEESLSDLSDLDGKATISKLEDCVKYDSSYETDDPLQLLNSIFFENGLLIKLDKETCLEKPIQILSLSSANVYSCYPRIYFELEERSSALVTFVSETLNLASDVSLHVQPSNSVCNNIVLQANLKQASKLDLTFIQNEDKPLQTQENTKKYLSFAFTKVQQEADSDFSLHSFSLGANLSRHRVEVDLNGERARTSLNGLYVLSDSNSSHNQLVLNHNVPNCFSEQVYKGILDDEAHAEFTGTINVLRNAQKTDARQLNKNLLISNEAKIYTRPQLQIEADDVKCSHGATIGQLEEEQIFYLTSRGISKNEAKQILTYGFAEEIIEKVKLPSLRTRLDAIFLGNIHH
ncbi:MAG: Fe-S cluster assembly protein SufD [Candidatus Caenarcaniphilales bacterium]|nr:Fe-S cluster assembly protein SufD [Candidatus Caenarcaniphilales bacterium]